MRVSGLCAFVGACVYNPNPGAVVGRRLSSPVPRCQRQGKPRLWLAFLRCISNRRQTSQRSGARLRWRFFFSPPSSSSSSSSSSAYILIIILIIIIISGIIIVAALRFGGNAERQAK